MPDPVALQERYVAGAGRYRFFQAVRLIERAYAGYPRIGESLRPSDDPVRFGQEAELAFAGAEVAHARMPDDSAPLRLVLNVGGLLGVDGPMPLHFTQYVRDRRCHAGDRSWMAFLDIFHHRMISLYYRAWSQGQPAVGRDRPADDPFVGYLGVLSAGRAADARSPDGDVDPSLQFAGLLCLRSRPAKGLARLLSEYFLVDAQVESHIGHWMSVPSSELTLLGGRGARKLGEGLVLGRRLWDRQHRFRVRLGPLQAPDVARFQPDAPSFARLAAWVRRYNRDGLDWDVALRLAPGAARPAPLGRRLRLGRNSWLGAPDAKRCPDIVFSTRPACAPVFPG